MEKQSDIINLAKKTATMATKKCTGRPKGRKTSTHPHVIRPKRPRSAYNFFFRHERNKIMRTAGLDEDAADDASPTKPDHFQIVKVNLENGKRKRGRPRKALYRPRKKTNRHGHIDFRGMAKATGAKWKVLSAEERRPFVVQAKEDLENYQKAMIRYYNEIADYEKQKGSVSSEDLPASETAAEATASVHHDKPKPLNDCRNASESTHIFEGPQEETTAKSSHSLKQYLNDMLSCSSSTAKLSDCLYEQSAPQNDTTMNDSTASSSPVLESHPQVPAFQLALTSNRLSEKAGEPKESASCLNQQSPNEVTGLVSLLSGREGMSPRSSSMIKSNYIRKDYDAPDSESTAKIPIIQPAMMPTVDTFTLHEQDLPAASALVKFAEGDFF